MVNRASTQQIFGSSDNLKVEAKLLKLWWSKRRIRGWKELILQEESERALLDPLHGSEGGCCALLSPVMGWPELSVSTVLPSAGMASPSSSQLRVVQNIPSVAALSQPLRLRQVCLNLIDYCSTNCVGTSPSWCWVQCVCWGGSDKPSAHSYGNGSTLLFCKEENILIFYCSDIL